MASLRDRNKLNLPKRYREDDDDVAGPSKRPRQSLTLAPTTETAVSSTHTQVQGEQSTTSNVSASVEKSRNNGGNIVRGVLWRTALEWSGRYYQTWLNLSDCMKFVIMTELVQHMDLEAAARFIRLDAFERFDWIELCEREEVDEAETEKEDPLFGSGHTRSLELLKGGGSEEDWSRFYHQSLPENPFTEKRRTYKVGKSDIEEGERFILWRCNPGRIREIVLRHLGGYQNVSFSYPGPAVALND